MKRFIILGISLLLVSLSLMAGPAYPGRIVVTQPDGTEIGIWMHGDEFGHWVTDDAGRILKKGADGFWRVDESFTQDKLEAMLQAAAESRAQANEQHRQEAAKAPGNNFGSPKIPVILIGFSDLPFSKTAEDFNKMLNLPGYSENDAVGSVHDYFEENSFGRFTPQFEVLGPVQIDNPMAYYGENILNSNGGRVSDRYAELALVHAAQKLDGTVDFSQYDNDGNGTVEFVIFYFAGFDEAQGGGDNCIWSHAWYLHSSSNVTTESRTFDGVSLDRYFCSSELIGRTGENMCHIGTTCHEFAHTLGLPDYYDTDYEQNGTAASMYHFDLMASGSYNANSTCPPYLNSEELSTIGWMDAIPSLTETGVKTLPSVNYPGASSYSAYKLDTPNSGECFIFETRGGQRWDAPLPTGLMVYHVDKSSNTVPGTSDTAETLWGRNKLNAYASHPCCYVVPALDPANTQVFSGSMNEFFFPGSAGVLSYSPTAWSGQSVGFQLVDISYANGVTTFNVFNSNQLGIIGCVKDSNGVPLAGATVSYSSVSASQTAPFVESSSERNNIQRRSFSSVTTDANGMYTITLNAADDYVVVVSKEGYQPKSATVTVNRVVTCNLTLLQQNESPMQELVLYPDGSSFGDYSTDSTISSWERMHANRYSSSFLGSYVGKQITEVSFMISSNATISGCHVFVDFGNERKCWLEVNDNVVGDQWVTVDVSGQNIIIPSDTDVFVGYAGTINTTHPLKGVNLANTTYIAYFNDGVDQSFTAWTRSYNNLVFAIKMTVGDDQTPDLGYNYIADPMMGAYKAGDTFNLTLVETTGARKPGSAVSWYLDDEPVSGSSVTLSSGYHVIEARFTTSEGKTKVVELELEVAP